MTDYTRTNDGYKYNWIERNSAELLIMGMFILLGLIMINWSLDQNDRMNFCNSILPIEGYENYTKNTLENKYCYSHINIYNYTDRYFDIPPRNFK